MPPVILKIELWLLQLDALSLVPFPEDLSRTASMADPRFSLRRARSKSALRRVLGERLSIDPEAVALQVAPGGKPGVEGCEFSISHSGPWLLIATGAAALGVDIETQRTRRDPLELAERFFHAADTNRLRQATGPAREHAFLRQWVAKEAASKAAGTGLGGHLHNSRCVFENVGILAVEWSAERWGIREFTLPDGTPGAVAWRGESAAEIVWRAPTEAGLR